VTQLRPFLRESFGHLCATLSLLALRRGNILEFPALKPAQRFLKGVARLLDKKRGRQRIVTHSGLNREWVW
jgi:hypothetical protein